MADFSSFKEELRELVFKFEQDKNHYLQKGYPEARVRIDFLNLFFIEFPRKHPFVVIITSAFARRLNAAKPADNPQQEKELIILF